MTGVLIVIAVALAVGIAGCAIALGTGNKAEVNQNFEVLKRELPGDAATVEDVLKKPRATPPDRSGPR